MQIDITMKRLLSLMALCCLVFVACSNDENVDNNREPAVDKITLSQTVIEVGFEPDTYSVNVTSPYSWDAFSASDWIEVVTYQGDAGVAELSFNVTTRNAELEKRMGSIVVTNSEHNLVAELYIIQKIFEPTEITIDRESLTFAADGGEQSITVTANFDHKATTDADWLRITKVEAGYTISASKYMEVEARTADVVISNEKYNISKTVSISQSAFEPILNVEDKPVLEFDYKGGEQSILVESNFEYDIATDADWVTLSKTATGVVVKVSKNFSDSRTANVTISSVKYNLSGKVVSIIQQASELEAVDLGLSVKWANCNVGANSPEEYGDYFAWGEISPKDSYYEDNCSTYGKSMADISGNPQYDAARANWGGAWRMPTKAELEELRSNCTWEWTTLNGVNGRRVTGPNGNSIFLPAAGLRYDTSSNAVGSGGCYWSSTPYEDGVYLAFNLLFDSDCYDWYWNPRFSGQSVRPVLE